MGFSPRRSSVPILIVGALFLVGGSIVGACDVLTGSTSGTGNTVTPAVSDSATLAHDYMPTGTSLPSPSEVPRKNGTLRAYRHMQDSTDGIAGAKSNRSADSSSIESPYGCYLATQPYSPAVAFRSVYLYFPEAMVEAAGNETKRIVLSLQAVSVEDSAAVAGNLEAAVQQRERIGVRYANCIIPSASGAESLASEQLLRVGEDRATWNALATSEGAAPKTSAYETDCTLQGVTTCGGWPENEVCGTDYEWNCSSSLPGGGGDGGGGPDGGGDGPGGYPGGGSGPDGDDGNGDGSNTDDCDRNPEPGLGTEPCDPCESATPPSYCEKEKEIPKVKDYKLAVDTVKIENLPDCSDPQGANELGNSDIQPDAWRDYCESSLPNATQKQRIEDALDRIEQRGQACARIAQRARLYLNNNLIYLDPTPNRASGWGHEGLVIIWDDYADRYYDDRTRKDDGWANDGNLDSILAHEFDHVRGEDHLDGTHRTEHTEQCSNIDF